jgi:hypothetical protein
MYKLAFFANHNYFCIACVVEAFTAAITVCHNSAHWLVAKKTHAANISFEQTMISAQAL